MNFRILIHILQFNKYIDLFLHRHNNIFKDVYREVGILEVFVGCLMKYSAFLQKHVNVDLDAYDLELTNEDEIENGKITMFFSHKKRNHFINTNFRVSFFQIPTKYLANW